MTALCHGPLAVFAELDVLAAAPPRLIAAGFGDMVGKLMSVADWRLGHVMWDEPYDATIERRSRRAAADVAQQARAIGQGSREAIRVLMEGLIESGFCMLDFGNSSPASGAEHHMSHFWELKLLREGRPAIFHGTKVGIASIVTAGLFHRVAALSVDQVAERLAVSRLPDRQATERQIREVYGRIADDVLAVQSTFLNMGEERFSALKERILDNWQDVQDIAANTPAPEQFAEWLSEAGGPTDPQSIGFSADDADMALHFGPYMRNRFTIARLAQFLGMM
jgi:glycerol-1-phosphate dehydrogenase [NAD(P)+]